MSLTGLIHRLPSPIKSAVKDKVYPNLLAEGEVVPEWALQSYDNSWKRHKNNKWTVMVFYPGDDTPGCTKQLQDLQNHYARFQELKAEVYAINPAEAASHQAFAEKFGFEFPILTDRGGVVNAGGSPVEDPLQGETLFMDFFEAGLSVFQCGTCPNQRNAERC